MLMRLTAAICGATILFACSSFTMARSEIRAVHSSIVDRTTYGSTVVGAASMYNPYRPGYREGGIETASGERYIHLPGLLRFKPLCVRSLVESVKETKRAMP